MTSPPLRLCFVCLGNICRSPAAEAVMRHLLAAEGLDGQVTVESAGTGGWHAGEGADPRTSAEARRRGIAMRHTARRFAPGDFDRFDLVLAMDHENLAHLRAIASPGDAEKVALLRGYDPASPPDAAVPDPYYGGPDGFAEVFDLVEAACLGLIRALRAEGRLA